MLKNKRQNKLNTEIKYPQIRVTDEGIMSLVDALKLADSKELDLVLINESANPPVCKLMDYEKYIYEQSKKPKNKTLDVKEIKLGPNMSENDIEYRVKHMIEFLKKGHRIKLTMRLKGRELKFIDDGMKLILNTILKLEDFGVSESLPKLEGKQIIGYLKPIPKK